LSINLSTVLDNEAGRALVKEYLDKEFLPRRDWDGILANSSYGIRRPLSYHEGQYSKYTRKGRARRPEHMASPGGAGSDPASGEVLGSHKVLVPIEYIHEFALIGTVANQTSWVDIEEWVREDMPMALKRRRHELVQNAFLVGRMTPGVYDTDGTCTTEFDQSAAATVTMYDIEFNFQKCPTYYAGGAKTFGNLDENSKATWADMRSLHVKLGLAGTPTIGGTYVAVMSEAMWNDLLTDDDQGRLTAAIAGGMKTAIKGLENQATFRYAGWTIVIDDQAFTEGSGADNEGKRANWGDVHSAICFGAGCFGFMPLGGKSPVKPTFKVQDITKTGYEKSIGYLVPWQVAILQPNYGLVYKAAVSESKPNNYQVADPTNQLDSFGVGV